MATKDLMGGGEGMMKRKRAFAHKPDYEHALKWNYMRQKKEESCKALTALSRMSQACKFSSNLY